MNSFNHPKILFVLKRRTSYGISYGLQNSASLVAIALERQDFETKIVDVIDNNSIDKEVHDYKPTHVFVEALWVLPSKISILLKLHPNVQWSVRIHSQVPFLGHEGNAFDWLDKYNQISLNHENFSVCSNSLRFIKDVGESLGFEIDYAPNICLFKKIDGPVPKNRDNIIDIGCFGAIRPFKNHLNQALAAITFANQHEFQLNFHINSSRFENQGEPILHNLKSLFNSTNHKLIEHQWSNHDDFIKLVTEMDLGMQVSFSETWNLVACDFVINHIPLIGSPEIFWLSELYQADPNKINDIVEKLEYAFKSKKRHLQKANEVSLDNQNKKSIKAWLELISP